MKVPMLDLTAQYHQIKEDIHQSMEQVMNTAHFIMGKQVKELESKLAAYSQADYGVGVASGSDALHLSLLACGIEKGDEVITSAFTFFATAGAIARIGAIPVFVDIDPVTFNIDPDKIEDHITEKTKAIIPVHLYGQAADMDEIMVIAKKYQLVVIEDAAQAIGAEYKGKRIGQFGKAACYSFFPTKNLGAYGDAGMIITKDQDVAKRASILRVHGSQPKYIHHVLGYNSRLDELQAAILNVKINHLDKWTQQRQEKARIYSNELQHTMSRYIEVPQTAARRTHIFHQYTIRAKRRDQLQAFLKANGISTMIYYPLPLHLQPVFRDLGYNKGDFPEAERACDEVISLPIFPELSNEQQAYVIKMVKAFYKTDAIKQLNKKGRQGKEGAII